MYLSSYSELYDMAFANLRLANIIGPRLDHGVIYDFVKKLQNDPTRLEVLGDGKQEKAYMYVDDVVSAVRVISEKLNKGHLRINISSGERFAVTRIAEIVCEEMGLADAKIEYTGTKRGWSGDVVRTDIDITLLKSLGWKPQVFLEEGIRKYIVWLKTSYFN